MSDDVSKEDKERFLALFALTLESHKMFYEEVRDCLSGIRRASF